MIRRDYILRMIEECIQALSRIDSLKKSQRWDEVSNALEAEFQRLIGAGPQTVARLSETELLAGLLEGEPTQVVRHKTHVLMALLAEAGDLAIAQNRVEEGRECYLKALHLLLDILARGDVLEWPEFVPKVESLTQVLAETPLPPRTHAMLMQHYERTGEFAKAEDALFAMLEGDPDNHHIVEFGIAFYQRLLTQSDATLTQGNLPRPEVDEGLTDLQRRRK